MAAGDGVRRWWVTCPCPGLPTHLSCTVSFGVMCSCPLVDNQTSLASVASCVLSCVRILYRIIETYTILLFFSLFLVLVHFTLKCTIIPMTVLYILGNITFQMSVENSSPHPLNCTQCWDYTYQSSDHVKFFNAFKLMHWYYNPVLWAFVLSFLQAFSHIFERKWIDELQLDLTILNILNICSGLIR